MIWCLRSPLRTTRSSRILGVVDPSPIRSVKHVGFLWENGPNRNRWFTWVYLLTAWWFSMGMLKLECEMWLGINVGIWLVVWKCLEHGFYFLYLYIYIGNNHPNWRTPSFFKMVETTKQIFSCWDLNAGNFAKKMIWNRRCHGDFMIVIWWLIGTSPGWKFRLPGIWLSASRCNDFCAWLEHGTGKVWEIQAPPGVEHGPTGMGYPWTSIDGKWDVCLTLLQKLNQQMGWM